MVFTNDNGGPSDTNASNNYPLSGTKANHLEGGIRVPMLMRWPTKFAANSTYSHPVSFLDFLPTFVAAAGGELPTDNNLDGINLLPFINGTSDSKPHNVLYWKKENRAAIRVDEWKLLRYPDRPAELYNIAIAPSETNNLAFEQPDKVRQMFKQLFEWELTLERPKWQLLRKYEGAAMERMDTFRTHSRD